MALSVKLSDKVTNFGYTICTLGFSPKCVRDCLNVRTGVPAVSLMHTFLNSVTGLAPGRSHMLGVGARRVICRRRSPRTERLGRWAPLSRAPGQL